MLQVQLVMKFCINSFCQLLTTFLLFSFTSCSSNEQRYRLPSPSITDLNPLKPLLKSEVSVVEIYSDRNAVKYSLKPESFDWHPVIRNNKRCWKLSGRNIFTTDYFGWKTVYDILKKKYKALSYGGNKTTSEFNLKRLIKISVGMTTGQVYGIMGHVGNYKENYNWGEVWFFEVADGKTAPVVFDNTDRVTGYGQKFYEQTLSDLGTGQF